MLLEGLWVRDGEQVTIEFEYQSSNFVQHKHYPKGCDIIVCWEHDCTDCPLEVIDMKSEIKDLENYPVKKPGSSDKKPRRSKRNKRRSPRLFRLFPR